MARRRRRTKAETCKKQGNRTKYERTDLSFRYLQIPRTPERLRRERKKDLCTHDQHAVVPLLLLVFHSSRLLLSLSLLLAFVCGCLVTMGNFFKLLFALLLSFFFIQVPLFSVGPSAPPLLPSSFLRLTCFFLPLSII